MESMTRQRQPSGEDDHPDDASATALLPELEDADWMHHARELAHTSFWAVARRLPRLVREAVALAWATSRRDTVASIGLNVAAGVMTTDVGGEARRRPTSGQGGSGVDFQRTRIPNVARTPGGPTPGAATRGARACVTASWAAPASR
ncbi:hypothetical protein ABZ793_25410 [Micromonospora sp. NPDC047465]|uniref:hypothetical protein n=1 Tax=Micromonospora sp. NPDC047465 TaxID=3154813 RepID=UPI0033CBB97F